MSAATQLTVTLLRMGNIHRESCYKYIVYILYIVYIIIYYNILFMRTEPHKNLLKGPKSGQETEGPVAACAKLVDAGIKLELKL